MSRALVAFGLIFVVACAGGEAGDEGEEDAVDAAPRADAPADDEPVDAGAADAGAADAREPDAAPPSQGGLGQACDQATPCPAQAPICTTASATATSGMCTAVCADGFAFTTDATGNPPLPPAGSTAVCTAIFDGTAGTAACATFLTTSFEPPLTGPRPAASTAYTADVMCGIRCGTGSTCPDGLRCSNQFCQP